MAETSDYSGWVPAGTSLRYSPPVVSPAVAAFDSWQEMTALTALVILYVTLVNDPDLVPGVPQVQMLPNDPTPESAVTPHYGTGMWTGPGVRYYVC